MLMGTDDFQARMAQAADRPTKRVRFSGGDGTPQGGAVAKRSAAALEEQPSSPALRTAVTSMEASTAVCWPDMRGHAAAGSSILDVTALASSSSAVLPSSISRVQLQNARVVAQVGLESAHQMLWQGLCLFY